MQPWLGWLLVLVLLLSGTPGCAPASKKDPSTKNPEPDKGTRKGPDGVIYH